jgi:hypothetical protein
MTQFYPIKVNELYSNKHTQKSSFEMILGTVHSRTFSYLYDWYSTSSHKPKTITRFLTILMFTVIQRI